jgi:ligand-binding sensor domain-containing protein
MNLELLRKAATQLGHAEPISIEPDGTIWLGTNENRVYLTPTQLNAVKTKAEQIAIDKQTEKQSALAKLGLTADEAAALFG